MVTALSSCYSPSQLWILPSAVFQVSSSFWVAADLHCLWCHFSFQRKFASCVASRCFFCPVFCWISPEHCWSVFLHCKSASFLPCSLAQTFPEQLIPGGTSPAPINVFACALFVKVLLHFTPELIFKVPPSFQGGSLMVLVVFSFHTLGTNSVLRSAGNKLFLKASLSAWGCVIH